MQTTRNPKKNAGIPIITNPYGILEAQSQAYSRYISRGEKPQRALEISKVFVKEIYWGKVVNDPVEFSPKVKGVYVRAHIDEEFEGEPTGVAILCETKENQFVLLKQFRHGAQKWFLTIPMGQNEHSDPKLAALEEIREETGAEVIEPLIELGDITPDPSFMSEKDRLYWAKVEIIEDQKDKTEGIESTVLLSFEEMMDAVLLGKYIDENGKEFDATDSYLQTSILRAHFKGLTRTRVTPTKFEPPRQGKANL